MVQNWSRLHTGSCAKGSSPAVPEVVGVPPLDPSLSPPDELDELDESDEPDEPDDPPPSVEPVEPPPESPHAIAEDPNKPRITHRRIIGRL